jgi:TonB-dependent starch-binding outer membrane protein SusC
MYMKKFYILLFVLVSWSVGYAQTVVKGTVKNVDGETIVGANVYVKGTSSGTQTDVDGVFQLQLPANSENAILVISSIGYASEEVHIGQKTTFDVILSYDLKVLEEVVVTGYTTEDKGKVTGAVSTINSQDLVRVTVPTLDQAFQGRAAGVTVTQNTGAPGEGVSIRIRGVSSLNSGNYPLYVVDGVPTLDISSLSMQDVEKAYILKDASTAALYGARGANGVVVITTKLGKSGEPKIQFNSQVGVQEMSRKIKMANTAQYVEIYNEAANTDNALKSDPIFYRKLITNEIAATLPDVDHVDAIVQNGIIQTHTVSVSGGNDNTTYFISGNYFDQEGIIKSSQFNRISGRVNIDTKVKKWLTAGLNLNLSKSTTDFIGSSGDGAGGNGGSVIRYAFFRTPALPIYNSDGSFLDKPDRFDLFGDGYNPVGMLAYNQNQKLNNRLFGKFFLKIEPVKDLTITSNLGVDYDNQNQRRFDRTWGTDNRINGVNRLLVGDGRYQTVTLSNFLNYSKSFDEHNLKLLLGTEVIRVSNYEIGASQRYFSDQTSDLVYLGNGLGLMESNESKSGNTLASFFGKAEYDYKEKYLASFTLRRDGSSRFGPENRWANFYAGSLGWRLDQESFVEGSNSIDSWLLRAGYGTMGNQEIVNYAYTNTIGTGYYYPFGNVRSPGSAIGSLGNSKIKWETVQQLDIGTDIDLWNGKLSVTLDYFRKVTTDMLMRQPLPSSVGQNAFVWVNNGDMLNRGFELTVSHANSIGDINYKVGANATLLHNEILRLDTPPVAGGEVGSQFLTLSEEGHPVGSFYLLEMEGIFQDAAEVFTHAQQGSNIKPGDVMYKDNDNSGVIDGNDRKHVGSPIPKLTAGLNVSLGYKQWDMTVFFQGAYGNKILSVLNRDIEGFYRPFTVTERYYKNHWTGPGTSNEFPRASWDASGNNTQFSTRFLEDGSYTRLKNLQIGYTVPKSVLSKYGFSQLRVYFSGTNLLTFTKFHGLDPEMTASDNAKGAADLSSGMDWGTYPVARSYNLGFNLTF